MSEQAGDIRSYTREKKTILDHLFIVGGWLVSFISLIVIALITYWAIKIPEQNINNLPIINAIKGDIRFEPADRGGKIFNDEDLSIYKRLDDIPNIKEKNDITLNENNENLANFRKELNINESNNSDQKELTVAIEEALKEVVNINIKENDRFEETDQKGLGSKLYLGSFDTFSQAEKFKKFIKTRNDPLLNNNKFQIFEKLEGERNFFTVQLIDIASEEEGEQLCSILSSRQFSCLLINEEGMN